MMLLNDIYVNLQGGLNTQSRNFASNASLVPGSYDVNWQVWMGQPGLGNLLYSSGWQTNQLQINPSESFVVTTLTSGLVKINPDGTPTQIFSDSYYNSQYGININIPFKALAVDSSGNYIISELIPSQNELSKVTPQGVRTVICHFDSSIYPNDVAVDSQGNYIVTATKYVSGQDVGDVLLKVTPTGSQSTIYQFPAYTDPTGIAIDSQGNYIVCETNNQLISKITPSGVRTVIFQNSAGFLPFGVALDPEGNYIVTDVLNLALEKISPTGAFSTIYQFSSSSYPLGVSVDEFGNYIVADQGTSAVSSISPSGATTVICQVGGQPQFVEPDNRRLRLFL